MTDNTIDDATDETSIIAINQASNIATTVATSEPEHPTAARHYSILLTGNLTEDRRRHWKTRRRRRQDTRQETKAEGKRETKAKQQIEDST
jgi:hypothetical protein